MPWKWCGVRIANNGVETLALRIVRTDIASTTILKQTDTISVPTEKGEPMYKSPIELLVEDIQYQIEKQQDEKIYKAVLHYVPNVDKEELIRALQYDRGQYQKGYEDGKRDALESIVRCKDCKNVQKDELFGTLWCNGTIVKSDYFCASGERKDNG
jgi:hypothetical protein